MRSVVKLVIGCVIPAMEIEFDDWVVFDLVDSN